MGSPVTTSRCVQMLRAASRCHENSRRRLKTGFGHGAPSLEKHRRIFFHFCFSGGSCKNGICIYIYMCTYVGIYIYIYIYTICIIYSIYRHQLFFFNHPWTGFATMVLQLPDTGRELDGIQPSRSKTVQLEAPLGVAARGEQCSKPWFLWIGGVLPKQW